MNKDYEYTSEMIDYKDITPGTYKRLQQRIKSRGELIVFAAWLITIMFIVLFLNPIFDLIGW